MPGVKSQIRETFSCKTTNNTFECTFLLLAPLFINDFARSVLLSVVLAAINLTMLAPYSIDFSRAASAAAKLFVLLDRSSAIDPLDKSGEQPSETVGHIELENVTFAYPTRPSITVLDDFSLNIPAGKVTALVVSSILLLKTQIIPPGKPHSLTSCLRVNPVAARAPSLAFSSVGTTLVPVPSNSTAALSTSST